MRLFLLTTALAVLSSWGWVSDSAADICNDQTCGSWAGEKGEMLTFNDDGSVTGLSDSCGGAVRYEFFNRKRNNTDKYNAVFVFFANGGAAQYEIDYDRKDETLIKLSKRWQQKKCGPGRMKLRR